MNNILLFLQSLNINKTNYIIVGCSGGPDSMFLIDLLHRNGYKIICAHVNHSIREESKDEYEFVQKYMHEKGIIFEGITLENKKNKNEEYYRNKRYEFYKSLADKYQTKYIFTAHHGDDLIETILMRISRGSNLKGYSGFRKVSYVENYIFVKPLIFITKGDIIKYNKENNIKYVIDKTNEQDTYTRNRYRHAVLPFLKKENDKIHEKYLQFSENIIEADEYINREIEKCLKNNFKDDTIDLNKFLTMDVFLQKKEIEYILSEKYGNDKNKLNNKHIEQLFINLSKNKNFEQNLPMNIVIKREYNYLKFCSNKEVVNYDIIFDDDVIIPGFGKIVFLRKSDNKSNNVLRLRSSDICLPLHVRNRKKADRICIKNLNGTKKIKSIFIDEKIDPSIRDEYPIVTDNKNTILWLPGLKKSKFDIENDEKYDIILRYERKGN